MRTFNPEVHNRIANIPSVQPWLGAAGPMDFTGAMLYTDIYWFLHNEEETAAMLFEQSAPGVFEQHTMFAPECRGKAAIREGKRLIHEMFVEHDARTIWGGTPFDNRPAMMFNRWIGGVAHSTRIHPGVGLIHVFSNDRDTWLAEHWRE